MKGGVGRCISPIPPFDVGRKAEWLSRSELKYGERDTSTKRCAVKTEVDDKESVESSESLSFSTSDNRGVRCIRTSTYSLDLHI